MRGRLLSIVAVAAIAAVAAVLPGCGEDTDESAAQSQSAPARDLPPLRRRTPQVVEPVAGETAEVAALPRATPDPAPAPAPGRGTDAARARASRVRDEAPRGNGPSGDDAVSKANVLPNGIALPPLEAPEAVQRIIDAGNVIARSPYKWGGGHGKWLDKGYDCSGSISYALASAGLLNAPLDSGRLMSWGKAGPGKWVTIHTNPGHVYMVVAGVRFDTSGRRVTGSRWQASIRRGGDYVTRHPPGL